MAQENKLRFFHTTDLDADRSTFKQVYPLGPKTYQFKKDKKELFYRQDKKGGFLFENHIVEGVGKIDDFDFFNAIDKNPLLRCITRFIITEKFCGGDIEDDDNWDEKHVGKFTMNDCKFDLDLCTIDANQNIVDVYSCFKQNKKEKFNILTVAPSIKTVSPIQNNFEFLSCRNKEFLNSLPNPCDGTGGWKQFFIKAALNSSQPKSTIFNEGAADDYYNCLITKDHAAWIKKTNGAPDIFELEIFRFADGNIDVIQGLDVSSTVVFDKGMFGWTSVGNTVFKVFRPDDGVALTVVSNHTPPIEWFEIDDDRQEAFYYDGLNIRHKIFSTGIDRIVDTVDVSGVPGDLNISYGDGLLAYHDDDDDLLISYNPNTFILTEIQTQVTDLKFLVSEDSFLTWFNIDNETMYLQNRDDTTFENIIIRENGGDCRWFARENEWLVFDDLTPVGVQLAVNLINVDVFSLFDAGAALPTNLTVKIENGWFLFHANTVAGSRIHYLDSKIPGSPNSEYNFTVVKMQNTNPVFLSAGVERVYISGKSVNAPFNLETHSIDMDSQALTLVETLTNDLNCIFMNAREQILSTNVDRVDILKENIQRDDELTIWFREVQKSICIGGIPTSPSGGGWILLRNQCNQFGTATFVRNPAFIPNPANIVEGTCNCIDDVPDLVVDEDDCISISINALVKDEIINPTTGLNVGTVIGPIDAKLNIIGNPIQVTFYIENPRDGSTYTWGLPGVGGTIISGQSTDVVVMEFTQNFAASNVTCQETNPCEGAAIPLINQPFQIYTALSGTNSLTANIPVIAEPDTYSGATIKFTRAFEQVGFAGTSTVVQGESSSSFGLDSKNRIFLIATHDGVANNVNWSGSVGTALFNKNVPIVVTPLPSIISVAAEQCPNDEQTFRIEAPRTGCVYNWSVDSPMFIVGPTAGESVVVDINGATGIDEVHVQEICPVQPQNLQLIAPCDELHSDSWWWKIGTDITYSNCRLLKNVIEALVAKICPDITVVRSDFFQWNPLNPSLLNYVYGGVNEYNFLTIAQKSDVKNPNASEKASIGNITWDQFAEWIFNIEVFYLVIDGELHIEHISRFVGTQGLDLTQGKFREYSEFQNRFKYAKEEMPRIEEYKFEEAENADFVGFPIEYKDGTGEFSECVNDETDEKNFQDLTTDLKFIQNNPGDISNEGFVIFATIFDGVDYRVITNNGLISGSPILNSPMAISILQDRFMRHNRILESGNLNRQFVNFESVQRFKKQDPFTIPFCCDDVFDPIDLLTTFLGQGQVETAEIDYKDDTMEIKLKYE